MSATTTLTEFATENLYDCFGNWVPANNTGPGDQFGFIDQLPTMPVSIIIGVWTLMRYQTLPVPALTLTPAESTKLLQSETA